MVAFSSVQSFCYTEDPNAELRLEFLYSFTCTPAGEGTVWVEARNPVRVAQARRFLTFLMFLAFSLWF